MKNLVVNDLTYVFGSIWSKMFSSEAEMSALHSWKDVMNHVVYESKVENQILYDWYLLL